MNPTLQFHVFCWGLRQDIGPGLHHVIRSRQYIASLHEWSVLQHVIDQSRYQNMTLAVYDCPARDFYQSILGLLAQGNQQVLHLVYRCHGRVTLHRDGTLSDDLHLWVNNHEYQEKEFVADVQRLLDRGNSVVVWVLACYAGACLDTFRDVIGRHPRLLVICSSNKWEKSATQVYDGVQANISRQDLYSGMLVETALAERENAAGKIELIRMIQHSPTTRWCETTHFRREQKGPVNTFPCYGNWSLYPFAPAPNAVDFVQPLRFQRLSSSVRRIVS